MGDGAGAALGHPGDAALAARHELAEGGDDLFADPDGVEGHADDMLRTVGDRDQHEATHRARVLGRVEHPQVDLELGDVAGPVVATGLVERLTWEGRGLDLLHDDVSGDIGEAIDPSVEGDGPPVELELVLEADLRPVGLVVRLLGGLPGDVDVATLLGPSREPLYDVEGEMATGTARFRQVPYRQGDRAGRVVEADGQRKGLKVGWVASASIGSSPLVSP